MFELSSTASIVIVTGAGISASTGTPPFRSDDKFQHQCDYRGVATTERFVREPSEVYDFYNMCRREAGAIMPNPAHVALARLERKWQGDFLLATLNVDGLHETAGSKKLLNMNGSLNSALCTLCGSRSRWTGDMNASSVCPVCQETFLRPDIVWSGEEMNCLDEVFAAVKRADLFIAIGASREVYPVGGLSVCAKALGVKVIEINLDVTGLGLDAFETTIRGDVLETVPEFVDQLLGDSYWRTL